MRGTFYSGPVLYLQMPGRFSFPFSNWCTRHSEKVSACRRQIRASEIKTFPPLLDGNCMWLCLHLVYLWFFDHDSMRRRLIPGVLWQFAGWQKALQCMKLDQRRQGLKSRCPAGRRSEETQTLARAIVRYTVAAGSRNFFPLYVFYTTLLSSAQSVEWLS